MRFIAGSIKRRAVTYELTGLPGKPKKRNVRFEESVIVANVVGFPGFIFRRPKCIIVFSPRTDCSSNGLTKSAEPIETPPDVTIISQAGREGLSRFTCEKLPARLHDLWHHSIYRNSLRETIFRNSPPKKLLLVYVKNSFKNRLSFTIIIRKDAKHFRAVCF